MTFKGDSTPYSIVLKGQNMRTDSDTTDNVLKSSDVTTDWLPSFNLSEDSEKGVKRDVDIATESWLPQFTSASLSAYEVKILTIIKQIHNTISSPDWPTWKQALYTIILIHLTLKAVPTEGYSLMSDGGTGPTYVYKDWLMWVFSVLGDGKSCGLQLTSCSFTLTLKGAFCYTQVWHCYDDPQVVLSCTRTTQSLYSLTLASPTSYLLIWQSLLRVQGKRESVL